MRESLARSLVETGCRAQFSALRTEELPVGKNAAGSNVHWCPASMRFAVPAERDLPSGSRNNHVPPRRAANAVFFAQRFARITLVHRLPPAANCVHDRTTQRRFQQRIVVVLARGLGILIYYATNRPCKNPKNLRLLITLFPTPNVQ